jgi:hypothetical protein
MRITIETNFPQVQRALAEYGDKVKRATREALNRTAEWAETDVRREMRRVFDSPKPYTLRSLRVFYASTSRQEAVLWFKQRGRDEDKLWAVPQIEGGPRSTTPMELRLQKIGVLPKGWHAVPGEAAPKDSYGNMSPGEISRILNVLGAYTEAGYNKANDKTRQRLKRGSAKQGRYGFEYWVNPVGSVRAKHLPPGVYRRVSTGFGSSLKPMLIFVRSVRYRQRLDFFEIVRKAMVRRFPAEFDRALDSLLSTGSASGFRRGM